MGTLMFYILFFSGNWEWFNPKLSPLGNALIDILAVLGVIISLAAIIPLMIIENVFIIPAWLVYNLCHRTDLKQSYVKFLGLEDF